MKRSRHPRCGPRLNMVIHPIMNRHLGIIPCFNHEYYTHDIGATKTMSRRSSHPLPTIMASRTTKGDQL